MIKDARIEDGPPAGFLAAAFQPVIGPGVTGIEEMIAAFGFIKGIIPVVVGIGGNVHGHFAGERAEAVVDIMNQPRILLLVDHNPAAAFIFAEMAVVSGVDGSGAKTECCLKSGAGFKVCPGRGFQVKAFVAPPKGQPLCGGVFAGGIAEGDAGAPVHLFRAYRQYQVGVHAVGEDINGDVRIRHYFPAGAHA